MRDPIHELTNTPHAPGAVPRLLVSAAHKSSGKTTFTIGLSVALRRRGLSVAPFKKGPDYIDPLWLARASGRPCYNLDPHLMPGAAMRALFDARTAAVDVAIVEANKGLYDGLALDGSDSNAAVAAALDLPVLLVMDARGMTRGIAPLILGYQAFDRRIAIAGVILNRVGGARHEAKLRAVIARYTDVPVLGAIHESASIAMVERHLGLMPDSELDDADGLVARIGRYVEDQSDIDRILAIANEKTITVRAQQQPKPRVPAREKGTGGMMPTALRIGVAMDRAFGFYYCDDLETLSTAGATIVPFDALRDRHLPTVDALFIGGGFPETCAGDLEANHAMRRQIRAAIEGGLPTYAECGGLMYLARSMEVGGRKFAMVGVVPGDVKMHARPIGRGYVELEPTGAAPFAVGIDPAEPVRAHEFHYSSLINLPPDTRFAYRVRRGHGIDGHNDGVVFRNSLASYCHLRDGAGSRWVRPFVEFACRVRARRLERYAAVDVAKEWSLVQ